MADTDDADREAAELLPCWNARIPALCEPPCDRCQLRPAVAARLRERDEAFATLATTELEQSERLDKARERLVALERDNALLQNGLDLAHADDEEYDRKLATLEAERDEAWADAHKQNANLRRVKQERDALRARFDDVCALYERDAQLKDSRVAIWRKCFG